MRQSLETQDVKLRIALLVLSVAVGLGSAACRKKQAPATASLSVSEVFEIKDPGQFSNEMGFRLVTKAGDDGFKQLNAHEQVVAAIWELEAEVNNGGFDQYFLNSSGDHAAEALTALEAVGAPKFAALLRQAMSPFPNGRPSPNRSERLKQKEALPENAGKLWSDVDGQFYQYPDNLSQLVLDYCLKNRQAFK
jgi:uncharacterized protein DUF4375